MQITFFLIVQFLSYLLSSFVFFAATIPSSGNSKETLRSRLVISLSVGPLVISWALELALRFLSGHGNAFYVTTVLGLLLIAGLSLRKKFALFTGAFLDLARSIKSLFQNLTISEGFLALGTVLILFVSFFLAFFLPLAGNDALEYVLSAKLIYALKDVSQYPFLDSTLTNGYFGPWSHPLGYPNLFVWGFLLQGSSESAILLKIIAPLYTFLTVFTLWELLNFKDKWACWLAALMTVGIPLYFLQVIVCHIDPIRIAAFTSCILAFSLFLKSNNLKTAFLTGGALGAALYTHSISILLLPMVAPLAIVHLVNSSGRARRVAMSQWFVIVAVGLAPAVGQYLTNLRVFGSIVADTGAVPVYGDKTLDYDGHFLWWRNLSTPAGLRAHGLFPGWVQIQYFALSYWILLLSSIAALFHFIETAPQVNFRLNSRLNIRKSLKSLVDSRIATVGFMLAVFFAGVWFTVLIKDYGLVKNIRYILTVQPLVGVMGAVFTSRILNLQPGIRKPLLTLVLSGVVAFMLLRGPLKRSWVYFSLYGGSKIISLDNELARLKYSEIPQADALNFINENYSSKNKFLSFRQSEFAYYLSVPYFSHLDPRIASLYSVKNDRELAQKLKDFGITHLYVPYYFEPVIYNSAFNDLLMNPSLAKVVKSNLRYRVYEVLSSPVKVNCVPLAKTSHLRWGAEGLGHEFASFFVDLNDGPQLGAAKNGEYTQLLLRAEAQGVGRLKVMLLRSDPAIELPEKAFLWEGLLKAGEKHRIGGQFLLAAGQTSTYRFEYQGNGDLNLSNLSLCKAEYPGGN
jgi:hypothetical protein